LATTDLVRLDAPTSAVAVKAEVADRPPESSPLVRLVGAGHGFGAVSALSPVDLLLSPGQMAFVLGPSGSGKTTLLRLVHGQLRARQGEVWVDGRPLHRRWWRGVARVRRQTGFVFQDYRLLSRLTAFENVVFALQVADPTVPFGLIRGRAKEMLDSVGLARRAGAYPQQLSGGERQRVAVARALAAKPALLLVDEPTSALDDRRTEVVLRLLVEAAANGAAVILTSHRSTGFERGHIVLRLTEPAEETVKKNGHRDGKTNGRLPKRNGTNAKKTTRAATNGAAKGRARP
jgi:ABC-type ATPase involved in cell division